MAELFSIYPETKSYKIYLLGIYKFDGLVL